MSLCLVKFRVVREFWMKAACTNVAYWSLCERLEHFCLHVSTARLISAYFSTSEQQTLQSPIRALPLFLNLKCSNCTQELSHHKIAFFHLSVGLLIGRKSRPNIMIPRKDVSHDRFPSGDLSL